MEQQHSRQKNNIWAEIEPYCVLRVIWKNLWMVLMAGALALMAAYLVMTLAVNPTYSCSATFAVTTRSGANTASFTDSAAKQFASLLTSSNLLESVSKELGISQGDVSVKAGAISDTNLIELTVSSASPKTAYAMADGILKHYTDYAQYVFSSVVLKPVRVPDVPTAQGYASNRQKIMLVAAPVGAVLMAGLLAVLSVLSNTVQTSAGAKNQVDGRMLGILGHVKKRRTLRMILRKKKTSLLISNPATGFGYAEAFGLVATQLEHAKRRHGDKVFLVSSVSENEGKSTVAANLALSLAKRHKKVLLVDCDLRKPALHLVFEQKVDSKKTLGELLKHELDPNSLMQALHYRKNDNLFCLYSAATRQRSAELFGSKIMRRLIEILRSNFDFVIVDSAPLGYFSDSEQLSDLVDASLLVIRQDVSTALEVNDAIDSLSSSRGRFLGYVLNDMHRLRSPLQRNRDAYGSGYAYGYGQPHGYGQPQGYGYGYGKKAAEQDVLHADALEETEVRHGDN